MKYARILCAIDLNVRSSDAVLDQALYLLRMTDAELHLLHVVEKGPLPLTAVRPGYFSEESLRNLEKLRDEYLRAAEQWLQEFVEWVRERGFERVRGVVREDNSVAEGIVWYAEQEEMDLIVMGTRGWTGMERVLMGSVAERVVMLSPCPVLVVPVPAED